VSVTKWDRGEHDRRTAVKPKVIEVKWDISQAQKGGFPHSWPRKSTKRRSGFQCAPGPAQRRRRGHVREFGLPIASCSRSTHKMVAAGTSYYAAFSQVHHRGPRAHPVEVEPASEFRYRQPIIDQDTLVIGVSQSGETADTLGRHPRGTGAHGEGRPITNVVGSSMALESRWCIYLHAGPEIGVASTKTFTRIDLLYLLGIGWRRSATGLRPAPARADRRSQSPALRRSRKSSIVRRHFRRWRASTPAIATSCTRAGGSTTRLP